MSLQRKLPRVVLTVMAALLAVIPVFPTARAAAHDSEPLVELRFPQEPQVTYFHDTFGARRSGGRRHQGNDLMAPKMTQVYAAADGVVETVAYSPRAGRYIMIAHSGNWSTTYAHLNNDNPGTDDGQAPWSLTVAHVVVEGEFVESGQMIGWVGDSGNAESAGSHTHFEVALNGTPTDAYELLQAAWERDYELYLLESHYKLPEESFPTS